MFIIGTGRVLALIPPTYLYSGIFKAKAQAFAFAIDTASIALAPNSPLFSDLSRFIIIWSILFWFKAFSPSKAGYISSLMFFTAFNTPFPPYLFSPSLNSTASNIPVDAPDGTMAHPVYISPGIPKAFTVTSASTVGFPLESMTSLPFTFTIFKYLYIKTSHCVK